MKKRKIMIFCLITIFLVSIITIYKESTAWFYTNGVYVYSTRGMGKYVTTNKQTYIDAPYDDLLGAELVPGKSSQDKDPDIVNSYSGNGDIRWRGACCTWHKQSNSSGADLHKIVNVIDFQFSPGTGYTVKNNGEYETFTWAHARLLYVINRINGDYTDQPEAGNYFTPWKNVLYDIIIPNREILGLDKAVYENTKNTETDRSAGSTDQTLMNEAISGGYQLEGIKDGITKGYTQDATKVNHGNYTVMGPFNINYNGNNPIVTIETNTGESWGTNWTPNIFFSEYNNASWNSNDDNGCLSASSLHKTKYSPLPKNTDFYIYFGQDLSASRMVNVKFDQQFNVFRARLCMLNNNNGDDQQLAMYASMNKPCTSTVTYSVESSVNSLTINKYSTTGEALNSVGFMIFNSAGEALYTTYNRINICMEYSIQSK